MDVLSPFLNIGTTFDFFQAEGKLPDLREAFASIPIGIARLSAHVLRIMFPIPSMPQDLFVFNDFKIFKIFEFSIVIEFSSGELCNVCKSFP